MVVPLAGALSITQLPPSERTRSVMAVSPKPLGVAGRNSLAVVAQAERQRGARLLGAVAARRRRLGEIDGERPRLAVADGIGDALLNAAIEGEIDRLAIGIGELADGDGDMRVGVAALEAGDQLVEKLGELDPAERARPELLEQRPVQQLEPLGDGENLADAPGDLGGALVGQLIGKVLDR